MKTLSDEAGRALISLSKRINKDNDNWCDYIVESNFEGGRHGFILFKCKLCEYSYSESWEDSDVWNSKANQHGWDHIKEYNLTAFL